MTGKTKVSLVVQQLATVGAVYFVATTTIQLNGRVHVEAVVIQFGMWDVTLAAHLS